MAVLDRNVGSTWTKHLLETLNIPVVNDERIENIEKNRKRNRERKLSNSYKKRRTELKDFRAQSSEMFKGGYQNY